MKIKKILKWSGIVFGSLIVCGFLFYVGTAAWVRYKQSQSERSNFDCKITGKETGITNCDKRSDFHLLSGDSASFSSPQKLNAVYIPFGTGENMTINLNKDLKATFDFWIVYNNYGIRELQAIFNETFSTISSNPATRMLPKANRNFIPKYKNNTQIIEINTKGPFITNKEFGPMGTKFDEFLTQGFNPKGVLIWIATQYKNELVELEVE